MLCVEPSDGGLCQSDGCCEKHQWRKYHGQLRQLIKEAIPGNSTPTFRSLLYVLISHMRGKVHMACYRRYYGGWYLRNPLDVPIPINQLKLVRALGLASRDAHAHSMIGNLQDQRDWIGWALAWGVDRQGPTLEGSDLHSLAIWVTGYK